MRKREPLLKPVQELLFTEWDPIGVNGYAQCRDEYDSYAPTLCRYLREGVDAYKIACHLDRLHKDSMGMVLTDEAREHNRRIAQRLLALAAEICATREVDT